jgi:SAM-dependent methyltransferase
MTTRPHDSWAAHYETVMARTYGDLYARLTQVAMAEITDRVDPPASIVDFGAGCGRMALPLAAAGYRVTAIEPSGPMISELREQTGNRDIESLQVSMQDFQPKRSYSFALCVFTVLAYIVDEETLGAALAAVATALEPGGLFLLDVPDLSVFQGFDHDSDDIIRSVVIDPTADGLYSFRENTAILTDRGPVTFQDEFVLRHWDRAEILNGLYEVGFETEADITSRFSGLGAEYLLMRRRS